MSDRLLSDWEICRDFCINRSIVLGGDRCEANSKSDNSDCQYLKSYKKMIAKTASAVNAEWVKWFEQEIRPHYGFYPLVASKWQDRKRSVGL